jgi:A/G-specific adenine glycosylase
MLTDFSSLLLVWYQQNARALPWRTCSDPYCVWVSEIMLQQTRVETVLPYFEHWMKSFPHLEDAANASEQEILQIWEGLGYYSRARNFHKALQIVRDQYQAIIPENIETLQKLPGVGRYTAAAIASIAFHQDQATLDGNIRRVFSRVFDIDLPARSPQAEKRLWLLAGEHLPAGQAGEYNQALMDLGAGICLPRNPRCDDCPVGALCLAKALGVQEQRPVVKPKPQIPHYLVTAAVIHRDGLVLIAQRPAKGLLGGLWEFPGGKLEDGEDLETCLKREICEELGIEIRVNEKIGVFKHAYTHFRVTLHAFHCQIITGEPAPLQASQILWLPVEGLPDFPMGKIDRGIANSLNKLT